MSDHVRDSLRDTIRIVKGAVTDAKRDVISAINRDESFDVQQLRRLQKLQSTLETAEGAYRNEKVSRGKTSGKGSSSSGRAPSPDRVKRNASDHIPSAALRLPILQALRELGGQGRSEDVLDAVGKKIPLKPDDVRGTKNSPHIARWRNSASWVRYELTQSGYVQLAPNKRGVWRLTDKGQEFLDAHQNAQKINGQATQSSS
jgi:hypothetical protein